MAKGKAKRKVGAGDVASNRYASYRYELIERLECGVVLEGTEVKALRTSGARSPALGRPWWVSRPFPRPGGRP